MNRRLCVVILAMAFAVTMRARAEMDLLDALKQQLQQLLMYTLTHPRLIR